MPSACRLVFILIAAAQRLAAADGPATWHVVFAPDTAYTCLVLRGDQPILRQQMCFSGPQKQYIAANRFVPSCTVDQGVVSIAGEVQLCVPSQGWNGQVSVDIRVSAGAAQEVVFDYDIFTEREIRNVRSMGPYFFLANQAPGIFDYTGLGAVGLVPPGCESFHMGVKQRWAPTGSVTWPLDTNFANLAEIEDVDLITFHMPGIGDLTYGFAPSCAEDSEGGIIAQLVQRDPKDHAWFLSAGHNRFRMTAHFPGPVDIQATKEQVAHYVSDGVGEESFAFAPDQPSAAPASILGMGAWLDRPAGSHGRIAVAGGGFEDASGRSVRFWGVQLEASQCCPSAEDAVRMADRFSAYGVDCVRLHDFTGFYQPKDAIGGMNRKGIGDDHDGTQFDAASLDSFDRLCAELSKSGIYYGFAQASDFHVRPGDRGRLLGYDEIMKSLWGKTANLLTFADDVQSLLIDMTVNLLKHRNPYTDKTYAEDPALAFIELRSEEDIFSGTITGIVGRRPCPIYRKYLEGRFCDWLKAKYGTADRLVAAWGDLRPGEKLETGAIACASPWCFAEEGVVTSVPAKLFGQQRLLDTAAFYRATQDAFYARFTAAIRATGYAGPLCGSTGQAPPQMPRYDNLLSDRQVGWINRQGIDRHNYLYINPPPGVWPTDEDSELLFQDSLLTRPGTELLNDGMLQVDDRPFGVSGWIGTSPTLYGRKVSEKAWHLEIYKPEGAAVVAVYGMGLQGWSSSFQSLDSWDTTWNGPCFNFDPAGCIEALYPALARMVYRGDVAQGDVISTRHITDEAVAQDRFDFSDHISTCWHRTDARPPPAISCPPEALAIGRCLVSCTAGPSTVPDLGKYRRGSAIVSTTGELSWNTDGKGFFTVDTPGTKAVVGHAQGTAQRLGDVTIAMDCPYGAVFVTALERHDTLATAKVALICAVAHGSGSGFRCFGGEGANYVLSHGAAPLLLAPVKARFAFAGRAIARVDVLDQNGVRTGRSLPVDHGSFAIDEASDKTPYYAVAFQ